MGQSDKCTECGQPKSLFAVNYAGRNVKAAQPFPGRCADLTLPGDAERDFLCVDCANKRKPECRVHGTVDGKFGFDAVPRCQPCLLEANGVPIGSFDLDQVRTPGEVCVVYEDARQSLSTATWRIALTGQALYMERWGAYERVALRIPLGAIKRFEVTEHRGWLAKLARLRGQVEVQLTAVFELHGQLQQVDLLLLKPLGEFLLARYQDLQDGRSIEEIIARLPEKAPWPTLEWAKRRTTLAKYVEAKTGRTNSV